MIFKFCIVFLVDFLFPLLQGPGFPFPGNGNFRGPGVDPGPNPGIPIVESIILLISGGIFLGVKAYRNKKADKH